MTAPRASLTRFAWLSIAAAIAIIGLKGTAYWVTGSVGLLSDALESIINLVAACVALVVLGIVARPADEEHPYGHDKAEYFSSGLEGGMILIAALGIAVAAIERMLHPQPLHDLALGLGIAMVASVINFAVARILFAAARRYDSITLEADAHHLMTDVWTSVGVLVGVGAAGMSGWQWLDPASALFVAANIVWTGTMLVRRSARGLMDTALPLEERSAIEKILDAYRAEGIAYHALLTRRSGARRFVSVHILVPGAWSVQRGHDLLERIEAEMREALPNTTGITHLEPIEDPASWRDAELEPLKETEPPA
ncbi:MAG TPA: cation diffusion facilitator family transporter [Burkholderiales bacterium]|nr:cation diffusion facilitator family transporter [Burkholderiales bacterium]